MPITQVKQKIKYLLKNSLLPQPIKEKILFSLKGLKEKQLILILEGLVKFDQQAAQTINKSEQEMELFLNKLSRDNQEIKNDLVYYIEQLTENKK